ncbi:T9SS type A sorting domain-containing protein [Flavobacterium luminosum]|uniref:T9SS type A sorting domain-containing protein n=1 Tax=Flavobacterium luminosum TaxID=2949086 RepID=A0ABT0TN23_9FLAO|nr:T9SS type A sorting domain-containing protein [Flavobacterium sp. HXWNR70]MCL9808894.1 T9SS type A sorting domain-containing protein [Flavobacterium sp. HXWNR70]
MKKNYFLFFLFFVSLLTYGQVQIGNDIIGDQGGDQLGYTVALSNNGKVVAIGTPFYDCNSSMTNCGNVRIYENQSGNWVKIGDFNSGFKNDNYGQTVSLSADGNIVAIGVQNIDSGFTDNGMVVTYERDPANPTNWLPRGVIYGGYMGNRFGGKVALSASGKFLAVGAPVATYNIPNSTDYKGYVDIYEYNATLVNRWKFVNRIEGAYASAIFGNSLSFSSNENRIAIGATGAGIDGKKSGYVVVYENQSGIWKPIGEAINGAAGDEANGVSISLSADGKTLAIGASNYVTNGIKPGRVRIFEDQLGSWTQIGSDIKGEKDLDGFGYSLSLSDDANIVAIGAYGNDDKGSDSGKVRLYKNIAGTWSQIGKDIYGANDSRCGFSVSLSGDANTIAIGSPIYDTSTSNNGLVRVYDLTTALGSDDFVLERFAVYPNPAIDFVTIQLQDNLTLERVNIYNSLGQLVKTDSQHTINISTLAKGTYYFEVHTNQGKATRAVVK